MGKLYSVLSSYFIAHYMKLLIVISKELSTYAVGRPAVKNNSTWYKSIPQELAPTYIEQSVTVVKPHFHVLDIVDVGFPS